MQSIIDIEIFNKIFTSIAEEMGIVLARSSFSSNIKERRDFSCALFDNQGRLVAQASHIPVHLGSMPETLSSILKDHTLTSGDIIITNDPYGGGSHLPDITLVEGVFDDKQHPVFYVVNRAHHADIGGKTPASMGLSTSILDEGVLIPPTFLQQGGIINETFLDTLYKQVRNPDERRGDLRAQKASLARGRQRLTEIMDKYASLPIIIDGLMKYAEEVMRSAIRNIPDGSWSFTDYLDDDGYRNDKLPVSVTIIIENDNVTVDFQGTADQVNSPINAVRSVTVSATVYVFQCLLGDNYPINAGSYRPIKICCPSASIVNALPPSPVAAGNVETSQRIVDVLLGALAMALPKKIPAASCGSMNNIAVGNADENQKDFTYYETIGGGMGGRPESFGLSGIHTHMTNTMNTPAEALEHSYPFLITSYGLRKHSGGQGLHHGGDGIIRSYQFLSPCHISLLTERRRTRPYGLQGGIGGKRGENILFRLKKRKKIPGKTSISVLPGDVVKIKTPGGGGWGQPE